MSLLRSQQTIEMRLHRLERQPGNGAAAIGGGPTVNAAELIHNIVHHPELIEEPHLREMPNTRQELREVAFDERRLAAECLGVQAHVKFTQGSYAEAHRRNNMAGLMYEQYTPARSVHFFCYCLTNLRQRAASSMILRIAERISSTFEARGPLPILLSGRFVAELGFICLEFGDYDNAEWLLNGAARTLGLATGYASHLEVEPPLSMVSRRLGYTSGISDLATGLEKLEQQHLAHDKRGLATAAANVLQTEAILLGEHGKVEEVQHVLKQFKRIENPAPRTHAETLVLEANLLQITGDSDYREIAQEAYNRIRELRTCLSHRAVPRRRRDDRLKLTVGLDAEVLYEHGRVRKRGVCPFNREKLVELLKPVQPVMQMLSRDSVRDGGVAESDLLNLSQPSSRPGGKRKQREAVETAAQCAITIEWYTVGMNSPRRPPAYTRIGWVKRRLEQLMRVQDFQVVLHDIDLEPVIEKTLRLCSHDCEYARRARELRPLRDILRNHDKTIPYTLLRGLKDRPLQMSTMGSYLSTLLSKVPPDERRDLKHLIIRKIGANQYRIGRFTFCWVYSGYQQ